MKIGVNDGHTLRGAGTGAVGIIKEGGTYQISWRRSKKIIKRKREYSL